jgi:ATP-dependent Lon protease
MIKLPLLPLRDIVIFPDMIVPLFVGREKSVKAIEQVMKNESEDKLVLLVTQRDSLIDNPNEKDLFKVGVLGNVLQMLKLPDGTVKVLVEGKKRIHTKDFEFKNDFIKASFKDFPEKIKKDDECNALTRDISEQF